MGSINQWWQSLTLINQCFYYGAVFFGVFFLWQLISAFLGLGAESGHDDLDAQAEPTSGHESPPDAHDTVAVVKLLSVRSIIAFFTLFTWAAALYLNMGHTPGRAMFYALLWGFAAMVLVSLLFRAMSRMTESGNMQIASCVGSVGTVYLNIPTGGVGEVKTVCSGTQVHLKAHAAGGVAMKAGTTVRVLRVSGPNEVEVEEVR